MCSFQGDHLKSNHIAYNSVIKSFNLTNKIAFVTKSRYICEIQKIGMWLVFFLELQVKFTIEWFGRDQIIKELKFPGSFFHALVKKRHFLFLSFFVESANCPPVFIFTFFLSVTKPTEFSLAVCLSRLRWYFLPLTARCSHLNDFGSGMQNLQSCF